MRLSIRSNTFETNSSSVHSFVYENREESTPIFLSWDEHFSQQSKNSETVVPSEPQKTLHLFSWLPSARDEWARKVAAGEKDSYGYEYKLIDDDPLRTALHDWAYESFPRIAQTLVDKAELLIMFFPARKDIEFDLWHSVYDENGYRSSSEILAFEGYEIDLVKNALERQLYICRENVIDFVTRACARHGYEIDYGIIDEEYLCHVDIDDDEEKHWRAKSGAGTYAIHGHYDTWESYYRYKKWLTDADGAGIEEFLFNENNAHIYTPEGNIHMEDLVHFTGDDFDAFGISGGFLTESSSYHLGKRYSATYERMG